MKTTFQKSAAFILVLVFLAGATWAFLQFASGVSFSEGGYDFGKIDDIKLVPKMAVKQVFTAKDDNLSQIKILLKDVKLPEGERIDLSLLDGSCSETIASRKITGTRPQYDFYRFSFDPISGSSGQDFCFSIVYESDRTLDIENDAAAFPKIFYSKEDQFQDRSYLNESRGKKDTGRTLVMRPGYGKGSVGDNLRELDRKMSQYKPGYLKGTSLMVVGIFFLVITVAAVILLLLL